MSNRESHRELLRGLKLNVWVPEAIDTGCSALTNNGRKNSALLVNKEMLVGSIGEGCFV